MNTRIEFTRPGAHSAKNARQAGAPNHLKGSGETQMVGNCPVARTGAKDPEAGGRRA